MLFKLSLRFKIISVFSVLAVVGVAESIAVLWYSHQIDNMVETMVEKEFVFFEAAQEMELALSYQKGYLTYYFVDGDGKWLKSLGQYRQIFKQRLDRVVALQQDVKQKQTLDLITKKYQEYIQAKDIAIEKYKNETMEGTISALHERQRDVFFELLELCRAFSNEQGDNIRKTQIASSKRTQMLRMAAIFASMVFTVFSFFFLYILYIQILGPIRLLAIKTGNASKEDFKNEVDSLKHSLQGMMRDFDETSDELARSRKHLIQSERMAMVGELAAGVAHTIRNPFTSIKMRMFSLGRSLDLTHEQGEDMQVISNEIDRIDRIVENFLEFSRPPKLRLEKRYLREIINSVLTLLEYRFKAYHVEVFFEFQAEFPKIFVDVDRIKEALVNVILNGCEAMENGGRIIITETREQHAEMGAIAVIKITDNGPGIPESILDKVSTPFFTTKEDGSGLGLSIVARIAREHNGKFIVSSILGRGTTCTFQLPIGG